MSQRVVFYNDSFLPEREVCVPLYDAALMAGEACFEVTRTFNHRPFRLREHLERLQGSLDVLEIDPGKSLDELEEITLETLNRNLPSEADEIDWQIIQNISRGPASGFEAAFPAAPHRPTILVSCFPLIPRLASLARFYETGVDLVVPDQRAIPPGLLPTHVKTRGRLHYLIAKLETQKRHPGCWPVLLDPDDHLTEGTSYNYFLVRDGALLTSPVDDVLIGITRGFVLEMAGRLGIPTCEQKIGFADARSADEMFVTATSFGIIHAHSFEGTLVGTGKIGPLTQQISAALQADVGLDYAAQARAYAQRLEAWEARQR